MCHGMALGWGSKDKRSEMCRKSEVQEEQLLAFYCEMSVDWGLSTAIES